MVALQVLLNGLITGATYALIALGLTVVYSTSRVFHLAHGVVVLAAGYTFWWTLMQLSWPWPLAALAAIAVAIVVNLLMLECVYEVLRRRGTKGLGYLIATLALLMLGTGVILALFGAAPRTFPLVPRVIDLGGITITTVQIAIIASGAVAWGAFAWLIYKTKLGTAMRATADNESVAEVLGVDTKRIRRFAFMIAGALAALAGIFIGLELNLDPNMGVLFAVRGFAAAVIGGVGSLGGAMLGSALIGFTEQGVVWFLSAGLRNGVTFFLLFLFLLVRPQGLFGRRTP